jgi:transposase
MAACLRSHLHRRQKQPRLIYTMLTKGTEYTEYTDKGLDYYEERYRERVMHHLKKRAEKFGFQIVPIAQPA